MLHFRYLDTGLKDSAGNSSIFINIASMKRCPMSMISIHSLGIMENNFVLLYSQILNYFFLYPLDFLCCYPTRLHLLGQSIKKCFHRLCLTGTCTHIRWCCSFLIETSMSLVMILTPDSVSNHRS